MVEEKASVGDHAKEWQAYKSLKRRFFLMWLFYLPVWFATFLVAGLIFGRDSAASFLIPAFAGLVWIGLFLSLGFRLRTWKCPNCHEVFHTWWQGIFSSRCRNCGLQRYS
jgi:hypothetical protein